MHTTICQQLHAREGLLEKLHPATLRNVDKHHNTDEDEDEEDDEDQRLQEEAASSRKDEQDGIDEDEAAEEASTQDIFDTSDLGADEDDDDELQPDYDDAEGIVKEADEIVESEDDDDDDQDAMAIGTRMSCRERKTCRMWSRETQQLC